MIKIFKGELILIKYFLGIYLSTMAFVQAQNFQFVEATIDDIQTAIKGGEMSCREPA